MAYSECEKYGKTGISKLKVLSEDGSYTANYTYKSSPIKPGESKTLQPIKIVLPGDEKMYSNVYTVMAEGEKKLWDNKVTVLVEVPQITAEPLPSETQTPTPTVTKIPVKRPNIVVDDEVEFEEVPAPTETPADEMEGTRLITEIFDDVYDDWFTKYVAFVYDNYYMTGFAGTNEFRPNVNISKAQVVQILYNMEGKPRVKNYSACKELSDVDNDWYTDAICWAYDNNIVTGDLSTMRFNPNAEVTREQLAVMLYRYTEYNDLLTKPYGELKGMLNADKVSTWAKNSMEWAVC